MSTAKQRRAPLHASMGRKAQLYVKKGEAGTIVPPDLSRYDDGPDALLDDLIARLAPVDDPDAPAWS